jgi:hypothetical protein
MCASRTLKIKAAGSCNTLVPSHKTKCLTCHKDVRHNKLLSRGVNNHLYLVSVIIDCAIMNRVFALCILLIGYLVFSLAL